MNGRRWHALDLLDILDYISDDSPDAAQCLIDEIEAKASKLVLHPRLYKAGRVHGTREMVVRTNYVVVYMENEQFISILRVLHVARQWPPAGLAAKRLAALGGAMPEMQDVPRRRDKSVAPGE